MTTCLIPVVVKRNRLNSEFACYGGILSINVKGGKAHYVRRVMGNNFKKVNSLCQDIARKHHDCG